MTIKLIATDLDGTFLDDRGLYDKERFVKMLEALELKGIPFVVATGNGLARIEKMFGELLPRLCLVAENGAYVSDRGRVLKHTLMAQSDVLAFLDFYADKLTEYRVTLNGERHMYMMADVTFDFESHAIASEELEVFLSTIKRVQSFTELPADEQMIKISMMVPEQDCEDIMADFNEGFTGNLTAVTSGYGTIDIIQKGVHKGSGLQVLLDSFAISPKNLMAFGDSGNDVEMLDLAGYSYAMANAPETLKAKAQFVAPSNREAGVFQVIEAYLEKVGSDGQLRRSVG